MLQRSNWSMVCINPLDTVSTKAVPPMQNEYLLLAIELFIITIISGVVYDHMQNGGTML